VRGTLIPCLQQIKWEGKEVTIVFDSDNDIDRTALGKHGNSDSQRSVAQAEARLIDALKAAGAKVIRKARIGLLAGDRAGKFALDDFVNVHRGAEPADLMAMIRSTVNAQAHARFFFAGVMETARTVVIGEKVPRVAADDIAYVGVGAVPICMGGAIDKELERYVRPGVTFYVEVSIIGAYRFAVVATALRADVVLCTAVGEGDPEAFPVVGMTDEEAEDFKRDVEVEEGRSAPQETRATVYTVDEMVEHLVYVKKGHQVIDTSDPHLTVLTRSEAQVAFAASKTAIPTARMVQGVTVPGPAKMVQTFDLWEDDVRRRQVDEVTFWPGAPRITYGVDGKPSYNLWVPHHRDGAASDPQIVIDHIRFLFGDRADDFIGWLAWIEQNPGEACAKAWLHISPTTGTGRNILSEFLGRVWKGAVALNSDIDSYLGVGFNGEMSRKLLTVVDEIKEGGPDKWSNAEKLKKATTAASRKIKPKYGHEVIEHDCNRLLVFSNHIDALPILSGDRRFEVVIYEGANKEGAYYETLSREFRRSSLALGFARYLAEVKLDLQFISGRAKETEDKQKVINSNVGDLGQLLIDILKDHPGKTGLLSRSVAELLAERAGTKEYKNAVKDAGMQSNISIYFILPDGSKKQEKTVVKQTGVKGVTEAQILTVEEVKRWIDSRFETSRF
jgi:hypothetical protein